MSYLCSNIFDSISSYYDAHIQGDIDISSSNESLCSSILENKSLLSIFWASMAVLSAYTLFDRGLARITCLETCLHGTGPQNYFKILLYGADPNFGGKKNGSAITARNSNTYVKNSIGHFHLFKDSELPKGYYHFPLFAARRHCVASATTCLPKFTPQVIKIFYSILTALTVPTLKFRFKPERIIKKNNQVAFTFKKFFSGVTSFFSRLNPCKKIKGYGFKNDPFYFVNYEFVDVAYKTQKHISPDHIGIRGTLNQGFDSRTLQRMKDNPIKALSGAFLIASAALVLYFGVIAGFNIENINSNLQNKEDKDVISLLHVPLAVILLYLNTL